MKKLLTTIVIATSLAFAGCCTDTVTHKSKFCITGANTCFFKQAFGNFIRSLEGSPLAKDGSKIPALIQSAANSWLPAGKYTDFVRNIINSFVAAHPVTEEQVNKVLETLAMQVQTGC